MQALPLRRSCSTSNNDGRLDFLCPDEALFPQKIYDTDKLPVEEALRQCHPDAPCFPIVQNVADSAIADFNNDGRMDMFLLGGVQLRPSSVVQGGPTTSKPLLAGGSKGFKFVTTGPVTFTIDWNKADEGAGDRHHQDPDRRARQASRTPPPSRSIRADPTRGRHAPAPRPRNRVPIMQIGYDPATTQWTLGSSDQADYDQPRAYSARPTCR